VVVNIDPSHGGEASICAAAHPSYDAEVAQVVFSIVELHERESTGPNVRR
jgi:hypothetical protein